MPLTGFSIDNQLLKRQLSVTQPYVGSGSTMKLKNQLLAGDTACKVSLVTTANAPGKLHNRILAESSLKKFKTNNSALQLRPKIINPFLEQCSVIASSLAKRKLSGSPPSSIQEVPAVKQVKRTPAEAKTTVVSTPNGSDDGLPEYNFTVPEADEQDRVVWTKVDPVDDTERRLFLKQMHGKKQLVDLVSNSLIRGPSMKKPDDKYRIALLDHCKVVSAFDPEFILKVALYARQELNIRTTTNLLLSFAAFESDCRPYLNIYFDKCVILPSDWIDVADQYQFFEDESLRPGSLPVALRKALAIKFQSFSVYHLAKYNKGKVKKKRRQRHRNKEENSLQQPGGSDKDNDAIDEVKAGENDGRDENNDGSDEDQSQEDDNSDEDTSQEEDDVEVGEVWSVIKKLERRTFTLKKLVRLLHLKDPAEYIMGLIGKRYPDNEVKFRESRLEGTWDKSRAGQRMKLPIPETWETQVSLKGNKKETWEELIDNKKVPYMAMLRNLRNIILAGVSEKHHAAVLRYLSDKWAIINSRQFPHQYAAAQGVLNDLKADMFSDEPSKRVPKRNRIGRKLFDPVAFKKKKMKKKVLMAKQNCSPELFQRYQNALNKAVSIATFFNISPIPGRSLVLLDVSSYMRRQCSTAKGLGKSRTVMEMARLLTTLCSKICEECSIYEVFCEKGDSFHKSEKHFSSPAWIHDIDDTLFINLIRDPQMIDNVIFFTLVRSFEVTDHFVSKYRLCVNPNLLYANVFLDSTDIGVIPSQSDENDVKLSGFTDGILRFIAERGKGGQVGYIERINEKYGLPPLRRFQKRPRDESLPQGIEDFSTLRSQTVKVFVSSTFRDMQGERDLLVKYVFPELRHRARSLNIDLREVDLRWGITEKQANNDKLLEMCLEEVSKCHLFIGILGERYGYVPQTYDAVKNNADLSWVLNYPPGASVTELEFHLGALANADKSRDKAFFYLRDEFAYSGIPNQFLTSFVDQSEERQTKLANLKEKIRSSGIEVFDGYPCSWGGTASGVPVMTGLEEFGQRVLDDLWVALKKIAEEMESSKQFDEGVLHDRFSADHQDNFVGRKKLVENCLNHILASQQGIILIHGRSGSGKTALMAHLSNLIKSKPQNYPVISFFVGATSAVGHSMLIFQYLCYQIRKSLDINDALLFQEKRDSYEEFKTLITEASKKTNRMFVFIDGIDLLEKQQQVNLVERLKIPWPKGITVICTAITSEIVYKTLLLANPVHILMMGMMSIPDRMLVIRQQLSKYGKMLDEGGFNNQLQLLALKRDANLPLFISLVCEELRRFGIYEKLTDRIKSLSSSLDGVLQDIIASLEEDFSIEMIGGSLGLLAICSEGLHEEDLYALLSLYKFYSTDISSVKSVLRLSLTSIKMLPRATFLHLLRSVKGLLQLTGHSCDRILKLAFSNITSAVYARYGKTILSVNGERILHCIVSGYFWKLVNPTLDGFWSSFITRALSSLPKHLLGGGCYKELEDLLCNLHFIQAKLEAGMAESLLDDYHMTKFIYALSKTSDSSKVSLLNSIKQYESFVTHNLHVLKGFPQLTIQQALNEPSNSVISNNANCQIVHSTNELRGVVQWVNKPDIQSRCQLTLGLSKPALCATLSPDEKCVAVGEDRIANIYELDTSKKIATFAGHDSAITKVIFVGPSKLCTASMDNTISIWNVLQQHRLHILKKHTRRVTALCCDPLGRTLVSVGWDSMIFVWKLNSGEIEASLEHQHKGRWSPINCVAFHPFTQSIVTGSWDSALRIWCLQTRRLKAVLHGHTSSVQSVSISPDGKLLASTALDKTLKLWSCKKGFQIASITGHFHFTSAHFTSSGSHIIASSTDKTIKIYSATLGENVACINKARNSPLSAVLLSSEVMVTGYEDGSLQLTNYINDGKDHDGHCGASFVTCIVVWRTKIHPVKYVIVGTKEGVIKVLNLHFEVEKTLIGHFSAVTCLAFASFTPLVLSGSEQGYIAGHYVKLKSREDTCLPSFICQAHDGEITCISFSWDYLNFATASSDQALKIWPSRSQDEDDPTAILPILVINNCHTDAVTSCCWTQITGSSSAIVITAGRDLALCGWDSVTGERLWLKKSFDAPITYLTCTKDNLVIGGSLSGGIYFWNAQGIKLNEIPGEGERYFSAFVETKSTQDNWVSLVAEDENSTTSKTPTLTQQLTFLTNGMTNVFIARALALGDVKIVRARMNKEKEILIGHSDIVTSVCSGIQNKVVSSSRDGSVKIWSPKCFNKTEDATPELCHSTEVVSIALDDSAETLVSGDRNGYVILWKKKNDHWTPVLKKKAHDKAVTALLTISKSKFVSVSNDCFLKVWQIKASSLLQIHQKTVSFLKEQEHKEETVDYSLRTEFYEKQPQPVTGLVYDPRNNHLVIGMTDDTLVILPLELKNPKKEMKLYELLPEKKRRTKFSMYSGDFKLPWTLHLRVIKVGHSSVLILLNSFGDIFALEDPNKLVHLDNIKGLCSKFNKSIKSQNPPWATSMACFQDSSFNTGACRCLCIVGLKSGELLSLLLSFNKQGWDISEMYLEKMHGGGINEVLILKLKDRFILITGGDDALLRIWTFTIVGKYTQIGQFHCTSPVTSLVCTGCENETVNLACGDLLGNTYILSTRL